MNRLKIGREPDWWTLAMERAFTIRLRDRIAIFVILFIVMLFFAAYAFLPTSKERRCAVDPERQECSLSLYRSA